MLPYYMILFLISGFALHAGNPRLSNAMRNIVWTVICIVLIVFAGLRGETVGVDTAAYINRYYYLVAHELVWDYGSFERGVKAIYSAAIILGKSHTLLLILFSMLAVPLYVISIRRNSVNPALSIFLFVTLGYFVFHLNGIRQGIALAFFMMSFRALHSGSFWRYALWVSIASGFHISALLTLPLYFMFRQKFSFKLFVQLVLIALIFILFTDNVFSMLGMINERYLNYSEYSASGGGLLASFYAGLAVIFIVGRSFVASVNVPQYDRLLNMLIIGAVIFVLVTVTGSYVEMTRMAVYFTVASVFLWPELIRTIKLGNIRQLFLSGVILSHLVFYGLFLDQIGGYVPYVLDPAFNDFLSVF